MILRCETCSLEFQTLADLNIHKTMHLSEAEVEHACATCHKVFQSVGEYEVRASLLSSYLASLTDSHV